MAFLEWEENLSVGIKSIDKQHKKLIQIINDFYDNLQKESPEEILLNIIERLKEYTVYHFETEENLFEKYNFDGYDEHKKEHGEFVAKIEDFHERFKNGKMLMALEVVNFIKLWIFKHIMGTDKKYTAFLIEKGVE
jgi:hemerythrin